MSARPTCVFAPYIAASSALAPPLVYVTSGVSLLRRVAGRFHDIVRNHPEPLAKESDGPELSVTGL